MRFYSFFILLFLPFSIFSQDKKQDWIKINNQIIYGHIQYNDSNFDPGIVFFKKDGQEILVKYGPEDISEFYLQSIGKTFVKKITTDNQTLFFALQKDPNWLFLYENEKVTEYLNSGDSLVYRLNKKRIIQDDVSKKKLRNLVLKDCHEKEDNYKLAKNSKRKLKYLLSIPDYCQKDRLGFIKAGLSVGYERGSFSDTYLVSNSVFQSQWSLGLFSEVPILMNGKLSALVEAKWSNIKYSNYQELNNQEFEQIDILVSYHQFEFPLLLRYYFTNKKISPFINIGSSYLLTYQRNFTTFQIDISSSTGDIQIFDTPISEDLFDLNDLNIVTGIGTRFFVTHRMAAYSELRFTKSLGINSSKSKLKNQGLELLLSFNF